MSFFTAIIIIFVCTCFAFIAGILVNLETNYDKRRAEARYQPEPSRNENPITRVKRLDRWELLQLTLPPKPQAVKLKKFTTFPEIMKRAMERRKKEGRGNVNY